MWNRSQTANVQVKFKVKWKNRVNSFTCYDLDYIPTIFKYIRNCFGVLNLIVRKSDTPWNEINKLINDKCKETVINQEIAN